MLFILFSVALISTIALLSCVLYFLFQLRQTQKNYLELESQLQIAYINADQLAAELANVQNKLAENTLKDPLTDLPSRRAFEEDLQRSIEKCKRYQLTSAILLLEINDLEMIRGALGFEIGNFLIKQIAERIVSGTRKIDTVTRFSENTFALFLSQINKPEASNVVVQRLLSVFSEPFLVQEKEVYLTISVGISVFPSDGDSGIELLQNAEKALNLAKKHGPNAHQFYQQEMQLQGHRDYILFTSFTQENAFKKLQVYYIPIYNINERSICCMDAYVHWKHPDLGLISSDELFHVAESSGRMTAFTEWLLRSVCMQLQQWKKLSFSFNCMGLPVLARHLENTQFIYRLAEMIQTQEIDPSNLILNVCSKDFHYSEQLEKSMNMLTHLGIKIAINNFGTQFSLPLFKYITIDFLKLNHSLLDDLETNEKTQIVLKSLVALTQSLKMKLVVTDVKNAEQMRLLQKLGCSLAQGSFFTASLGLPKEVAAVIDEQ